MRYEKTMNGIGRVFGLIRGNQEVNVKRKMVGKRQINKV